MLLAPAAEQGLRKRAPALRVDFLVQANHVQAKELDGGNIKLERVVRGRCARHA
jgi:hypothetical protein